MSGNGREPERVRTWLISGGGSARETPASGRTEPCFAGAPRHYGSGAQLGLGGWAGSSPPLQRGSARLAAPSSATRRALGRSSLRTSSDGGGDVWFPLHPSLLLRRPRRRLQPPLRHPW